MELKVREILRKKGDFVLTVSPETPAIKAVREMVDYQVGSVLISGEELMGIFTERDFLRRVTLNDEVSEWVPVREVMTSDPIVAKPGYSAEECLSIITRERVRHLPVVNGDGEELVGIVSIGDCVKHLNKRRKTRIRDLNDYIRTGGYPG